jgi:uncharacterized protein (DUF2062 family)
MSGGFHRRIVKPVLDLLRQGATPEKVAAAIAVGSILGVFPVLGSTTLLCTLAALGLGLNLPLIQLVNCVVYPLQLILLIPMLQGGQQLFGGPRLPITMALIFEMARVSIWNTVATLGVATGRAIVVWMVASCVLAPAIYLVSLPALRGLIHRLTVGIPTDQEPPTAP